MWSSGEGGRRQQRPGRDPEADDDVEDELEALLDDARKLSGSRKRAGKRVHFADADEAGSNDGVDEEGGEGRAEDAKYTDFFGPEAAAEDGDGEGADDDLEAEDRGEWFIVACWGAAMLSHCRKLHCALGTPGLRQIRGDSRAHDGYVVS